MTRYLVSYDLQEPGKEYPKLIAELERLGAKRVLKSQWCLRRNGTAEELRKHIQKYLDTNDRIVVCEIEINWSAINLIHKISQI